MPRKCRRVVKVRSNSLRTSLYFLSSHTRAWQAIYTRQLSQSVLPCPYRLRKHSMQIEKAEDTHDHDRCGVESNHDPKPGKPSGRLGDIF